MRYLTQWLGFRRVFNFVWYRLVVKPLRLVAPWLQPRLGNLQQHPPVPLKAPKPYTRPASRFPLISIVTPNLNQGQFIERTILSVIEQGYKNLEYYIQDGGSRDNSVDVIRRYAKHLTDWVSEPDSGQSQAINLGFERTRGEIMAWLNADDKLLPGALAYVAHYFSRHPDVDVIYGHRVIINSEDFEVGRWLMPPHSPEVLKWVDFIPQETLFWRRRIWRKVGGCIDECFDFAMDWDLLLRFQAAGAVIHRAPRFLGAFRTHPAQKTLKQMSGRGRQEITQLREQNHGRPVTREEIHGALSRYMVRHLWEHWRYRVLSIMT